MTWTTAQCRAMGALKLGISVEEYERHVAAGEKWCRACREWQDRSLFYVRRSRPDGLDSLCRARNAVDSKPRVSAGRERKKAEKKRRIAEARARGICECGGALVAATRYEEHGTVSVTACFGCGAEEPPLYPRTALTRNGPAFDAVAECPYCGSEFTQPANIHEQPRVYCSMLCASRANFGLADRRRSA